MNRFSTWDDTIAALATPPGVGAIGVIRVSGPRAIQIVDGLLPSKDLAAQPTHTIHVGSIRQDGEALDEVVISLFRGPRSYTGEDVVEISCHGSVYVQQRVLEALHQNGCRPAKAGEFTQRAFLNGKLDLAQAEGVADLIASQTHTASRAALRDIRGGFSHELKAVRDELISFSALVELELDFSQEDVTFADRTALNSLLEKAAAQIATLLDSFRLGNVIRNGVQVAIVGPPNAGKSTLLNALLQQERAIVSEIAGTTRDTIEETLNIGGILFRLTDTAGMREATPDEIERIGISRSREKMREADIVVYLFDLSSPPDTTVLQRELSAAGAKYIIVGNKSDSYSGQPKEGILPISARQYTGIEELKDRLYRLAVDQSVSPDQTIVTNTRHVASLKAVAEALADVRAGLASGLSGDLLAIDIRRCLHHLGEITGEITHEDQLDYIFSKFCIGK